MLQYRLWASYCALVFLIEGPVHRFRGARYVTLMGFDVAGDEVLCMYCTIPVGMVCAGFGPICCIEARLWVFF